MLRAQAFENIFTLVPILLIAVISIVLRARAARRRKQRGEAAGPSEAAGQPTDAGRTAGSSRPLSGTRQGRPRPVPQQLEAKSTGPAVPFSPQKPPAAPIAGRESYAYPPPLPLDDLQSQSVAAGRQPRPRPGSPPGRALRRPAVNLDLRERMEARAEAGRAADSGAAAERISVSPRRASIAARLERLPPLKRAIVWAEILGPPGGLQ